MKIHKGDGEKYVWILILVKGMYDFPSQCETWQTPDMICSYFTDIPLQSWQVDYSPIETASVSNVRRVEY